MNEIPLKYRIWSYLAVYWAKHFSLDAKLRKFKAIARISFIEGEPLGGSIIIEMNGVSYFFEGTAQIEEWNNFEGKKVIRKILKYGGWEMDMTHHANKIII